ncbi:hypothetical protein HYX19_04795 [Candidatus Woesearchaeota archaeon]|nr:hypothetical protein [Candidatus Woesearchaeota archaeon]
MVKNYFGMLGFEEVEIGDLLRHNYEERLKRRHRSLARKLHPDTINKLKLPEGFDREKLSYDLSLLMGEVSESYEVLYNQEKRRKYLAELVALRLSHESFERTNIEAFLKRAKLTPDFYKELCQ